MKDAKIVALAMGRASDSNEEQKARQLDERVASDLTTRSNRNNDPDHEVVFVYALSASKYVEETQKYKSAIIS